MNANRKRHICFFLDYGCCLWDADGRDPSCLWPYEEILSSQTRAELEAYIREFDASYDWGFPPYEDFTVEDCRRFNRETRRIFALITADTKDTCIICNNRMELTEDEAVLVNCVNVGVISSMNGTRRLICGAKLTGEMMDGKVVVLLDIPFIEVL